jgi:hypothetical protein
MMRCTAAANLGLGACPGPVSPYAWMVTQAQQHAPRVGTNNPLLTPKHQDLPVLNINHLRTTVGLEHTIG